MDPADQVPEVSIPEPHRPGANGTAPGTPAGESGQPEQRSFISVIIHSFFIIPFLIAIFAGLLVVTWRILTNEPHSVYDYVSDVKVGGATKRWQAAFELSKILADPDRVPEEQRFVDEMVGVFDASEHDDPRVRQYLAQAMALTGNRQFIAPIAGAIAEESEGTRFMLLVALGMFGDAAVLPVLEPYLDDQSGRVRSGAATAMGLAGNPEAVQPLKRALHDPEPGVSWDAALALARLGDLSGKTVLLRLLDRNHLAQFANVDDRDQNLLMATVIAAVAPFGDPDFQARIAELARDDVSLDVRRIAQQVTH
ncbi:MAG: HEAT repeat domain-containing protein [Spirochaetaceae bacterium]|nr:HEAT repeat domain-containing protein [Spirochaetaceae bacterium]